MSIILTPFAKLILLFYNITGSYGASLILFAFVIRLVLFPAFLKGRKGMMGMSSLTEKQKVLQQKYAKNRQKYSEELHEGQDLFPNVGSGVQCASPFSRSLGRSDTFQYVYRFIIPEIGSDRKCPSGPARDIGTGRGAPSA